jgi:tRNA pseudouridine55 synthase
LNGWIILDKPTGISSAHAVAKVKRLLRPAKIGHAGTLDPLASGVLPLALGEATKTVSYMMDAAKSYSFTVTWGQERSTDDSAGEVLFESSNRPSIEEIIKIIPQFIGKIQQTPPNYSAIKLGGKRAYDLARSGQKVEIKSREVTVNSLEILNIVDHRSGAGSSYFICHCGKGTYIRSLARDMGRILGCYGYISSLRRLQVGKFNETHAISLENLADMVHKGEVDFLQPVESALDDILAWDIDSTQVTRLRQGQTVDIPDINSGGSDSIFVLARDNGKAMAICKWEAGVMKPVRVFNL